MEALPPVEGNAFELRDALVRLILNAVDAMPRGRRPRHPGRREASGWVVVEVRDTGVGMSDETRRRLAEHARSLQPGPRVEPGPRPGLRHRRAPRRQLAIESEIGKGTARAAPAARKPLPDHPRLRRARRAPGLAGAGRARAAGGRRPAAPQPCSRTCCAASGHAMTTAANGEEALAVFDPRAHDVVITDLGMPRMNGSGGRPAGQGPLARRPRSSS